MSLLTACMILGFAGLVVTYLENAENDARTDFKIGPRPKMLRKWQPWFVGLCIGLAAGVIRWLVTGDAGAIIGGAMVGTFAGYLFGAVRFVVRTIRNKETWAQRQWQRWKNDHRERPLGV
jgi:hypothetical protein